MGDLTPMPVDEPQAWTMSFYDALREVAKGKMVKRISWGDSGDYGLLKDDFLTLFTKGEFHTWSVSAGDMEGQDWILVNDLN